MSVYRAWQEMVCRRMTEGGEMEKSVKLVLRVIGILLAGWLGGGILLTAVYMLPTGVMKRNVTSSIDIFYTESVYPQQVQGYKSAQLDNETDAVMLLGAIYERKNKSALQAAMAVPHTTLEGENSFCITLKEYLWDDFEPDGEANYSRYWHGYMIWLKPLLLLMDYADIRMLNMIIQTSLLLALLAALVKKKMFYCIPALGCALVILNPAAVSMSLQFSSIYYIILIALLVYLKYEEKWEQRLPFFFLLIGMAVAYFDFLTYPAAAFCIPAGLVLSRREKNWKAQIGSLLTWGIFWMIGYGGMWAGKWCIGSLVLDNNIFLQAFERIGVHSGEVTWIDGSHINVLMVLWNNIRVLLRWPYAFAALFLGIFYLKHLVERIKEEGISAEELRRCMAYIVLAVLPILWLIALKSHSAWCYWYTYRNLAASGFCLCICMGKLTMQKQKKKDEKNV